MGSWVSSCSPCCKDAEQNEETGDRSNLIDPSSNNCTIQRNNADNYYSNFPDNVYEYKAEEISDLNKILQEMATNVIDVAPSISHCVEQQEYRERINYYMNKMMLIPVASRSRWKLPKYCMLADVPAAEKANLYTTLSEEEMCYINKHMKELDDIIIEMKIEHEDNLVVPFKVSI